MAKEYMSQKKKIIFFITEKILPLLKKRDLDYEKVVTTIMSETMSSRASVEEILRSQIPANIDEIHILTIPKNRIPDWLESMKEEDRIAEEIKREVDEALK